MRKILMSGLLFVAMWCKAQVVTYTAPQGMEMKHDFRVEVSGDDGVWKAVDVYPVKVDHVDGVKHKVEVASMAYFDFEGSVKVRVVNRNGLVNEARVRPLACGIQPAVSDSIVEFELDVPRNLSIEVNGDIFHNLHLFAGKIDRNDPLFDLKYKIQKNGNLTCRTPSPRQVAKALKSHENLIYFAPGEHQLPGDTLDVKSGETVYIAGGARVYGTLRVKNAENVRIMGRGIVHPKGRGEGVYIMNSSRVKVEGIISTQVPTGGSNHVEINNVKVISSYGWGDGLNVFASNHVTFDGCFARTSDDCTTVYATRKGFVGGCQDIEMRNSVLWADVAHPIFIGLHGNVPSPEVIENIRYKNIDILDHKENQVDYQGCLAINAGDNNLVRNITFEDIRIENFRKGQLINLRIFYNKKYCQAPGRGIENVLFKNVSYAGEGEELSHIIGYDEERKVKNIRFENFRMNGRVISDDMPGKPGWYKTADMARFFIGEHVEGVTFAK